ncbi:acetyl esterase/lipase [Kribbella aluminosa]|uniref:Acetyl esterase/lipase n=1 Tax=Kribbella aluminosa TaxID=416017 RepID=A0ABS4UII1_9ACTN|nr:alpha/beta hydrolase [Kribbella aluminosa]MBP2351430.1 acetyl esterase/lipase [Kribbella aluminosa]
MTTYDPQLAPYVSRLPSVDLSDIVGARLEMERVRQNLGTAPTLRDVCWDDRQIGGDDGSVQVRVRVYEPVRRAAEPTPAILFLHGGGFVMGSIESEHLAAGVLAVAVGVVVVSVEYRLAPEHPYPAALEDAYLALQWAYDNCDSLGIDPRRIAVLGNSAGGGLAAALAILARDRQGPPICFQALGIPEVDDRLITRSSREFVDTPLWTRAAAELSWRYYLGELYGQDILPLTAAPGRAVPEELVGLPPAYVSAMQNDPLRDEDVNYALALMHAGAMVELHSFPGTFHGSAQVPSHVSKRHHREQVACLRQALGLLAD